MERVSGVIVYALIVGFWGSTALAGEVIREQGASRAVQMGEEGRLVYHHDARGNRLPDFSYVGYHSGIVLRGEGNDPDGTWLIAAGYGDSKYKRTLIRVGNNNHPQKRKNSRSDITDDYVPIGAHSFTVASVDGYQAGDRILLYRPSTAEWISSIGTDQLAPNWQGVRNLRWEREGTNPGLYFQRRHISHPQRIAKDPDETWDVFKARVPLSDDGTRLNVTRQWQPGEYDFYFERVITGLDGNTVTIDAPVVHAMEKKYGGGAIYQYDAPGRVREVGVENLRIFSAFAEPVEGHPFGDPARAANPSENHGWHAIRLSRNTENTWVRNITAKYFGWSVVSATGKRATIQDCVSLGHASRRQGGRRYPFMISGQMNLVQRCVTYGGRHEFVSQRQTAGPNAFVDCVGIDSLHASGPHHRYSVGTLFDNVKSEFYMESRFRGSSGTGHGWAGTQTVFYNSIAPQFRVGAPPGGISWVLGCAGEYSPEKRLSPASLYYQQVRDRLGPDALTYLLSQEQVKGALGTFAWVESVESPE